MKNLTLAAAITSALVVSGSAMAATDGLLGTESTGTSVVTIIKDNAVQISDVDDLNFGTESTLAADTPLADDVCVFSSTGGYQITITSTNGSTTLLDPDPLIADIVNYTLTWDGAPVALGTTITGLTGDSTSLTCNGTPNATFQATVDAASFNVAAPGAYSDTLTLFVEPE